MNVTATLEEDQLLDADSYCEFLNDIPMPVVATTRLLMKQIREGDESLNPLVAFEFKRFLKSPTMRRYFLAAAAQYKRPHEAEHVFKRSSELIELFTNEELLIFLLSVFMYKSVKKKSGNHAHWENMSHEIQLRIHSAFYLGECFEGVGPFHAWLALVLPFFTMAGLLDEKGAFVVKYLNALKDVNELNRTTKQREIFKFSLTDIQANICRRLGLGASTSNIIYTAAFNPEDSLNDPGSFSFQRDILNTWHSCLIRDASIPDIKHHGHYYPSEQNQQVLSNCYKDRGAQMIDWLECADFDSNDILSANDVYQLTC